MATKVSWGASALVGKLYFDSLGIGDCFKIVSRNSKGAIYRKVYNTEEGESMAEELATGKLFRPSSSEVAKVDVEIVIAAPKPAINGY